MLSLYVLTVATLGSGSILKAVLIFGVTVRPSNEMETPSAALLRLFGQLLEIVHSILSADLLQKEYNLFLKDVNGKEILEPRQSLA